MPADPTEMTHCPTKQEEDTNLDPAQTEKIKVLLASFHSDHKKFGHTATPEEVFINYGKTQQLGIQERDKMFRAFLLAWPSTGFLLYNISEFFQKIDFVLEFAEGEITQDLSSPFVFLSESHHSYWRWKFDEIIMGVRCSRLAELKSLSKAKDHVKMCELLRMRFNTMEESTQGLVIVYLQSAEAYSRALKEGLDTLDRIDSLSNRETQLSQVTKEGIRQRTGVSQESVLASTASPADIDISVGRTSGLDVSLQPSAYVKTTKALLSSSGTSASLTLNQHHIQTEAQRPPRIGSLSTQLSALMRRRRDLHHFLDKITDKTAALFLFATILVISACLIGVSFTRTRTTTWLLDDGFFSCSSAACLQLFSLYLLLLPILRRRVLEISKVWFVLSILLSTFSAIISVIVYPYSWQASSILGFFSNVAAAIATVQLIEGTDAGMKAKEETLPH